MRDRSRSVARGGVKAEDPLDTAACVETCVVKTRYQILYKRIERVSRVVCSICCVVDLVVEGVRRWALFGLRGRPQKISAVG